MPKQPITTEQRIVLPNVNWTQFEQLLTELGPERQTRLTYFRGKLELMTPVPEHERCHKLIDSLILLLVDELGWTIRAIAPATLTYEAFGCATEPDACYYCQDSPLSSDITLPNDPPPDLLLEVALTHSSLDKLPVYASMGIPEIWRYVTTAGDEVLKGQLLMYELQDHRYIERSHSLRFPFLPAQRIIEFLEQSDSISLATALRMLRDWAKTAIRP